MLLIVGVGGHATVVLETARSSLKDDNKEVLGIVSWRYPGESNNCTTDLDRLGDLEKFVTEKGQSLPRPLQLVCAIGDNEKRRTVVNEIEDRYRCEGGVAWISVVHASAVVSPSAIIGAGSVIAARSVVQSKARIGAHCIVNTAATIDHDCTMNDFAHCAPGVVCCGNVRVGEGALIGVGSRIVPNCAVRPWVLIKAGSTVVQSSAMIPIYRPRITAAHKRAVQEAIESEWISWQGAEVSRAENLLKPLVGTKHVLLMSNGTTATHCLFMALRWRHPQLRHIYVPNCVYVAAWNAVLHEYGETTDVLRVLPLDTETWNVDVDTLVRDVPTDHSAAVLIVHNVGNIVNVPALQRLRPDLIFLEDACEGLFGSYESAPVCSAAFASSVSFFANKTITCGEGGAFCTNDDDVAAYIRRKASQGVTEVRYVHDILGYNYRITNLQAALLVAQLHDVGEVLTRKRYIAKMYRDACADVQNVSFPCVSAGCQSSAWLVAVRVRGAPSYGAALAFFAERFVETRPMFYRIETHAHLAPLARTPPANVEAVSTLENEVVMLPSFPTMSDHNVRYVAGVLQAWSHTVCKAM